MNDVMSGGLHRVWKHFTINTARLKKGDKVLDIAGGTGDLSRGWAKTCGQRRRSLADRHQLLHADRRPRPPAQRRHDSACTLADAEKLPFPDNYFNLVSVAFGLRNMTHKDAALKEMYRVLKPGGTLLVLEFFQSIQTFGRRVRPLLFQTVADYGQTDCQRCRQLPIPRRVYPYAPRPRNLETNDAGCRLRQRGLPQHERRHRCPA